MMKICKIDAFTGRDDLVEWVKLLCETDVDNLENLFIEKFYDKNLPIIYCISQFRDFVKNTNSNSCTITESQFDELIEKKDYKKILILMEKLFLEPIKVSYIDYLKEAIKSGIRGKHIVQWDNEGNRAISIIIHPKRALDRKNFKEK